METIKEALDREILSGIEALDELNIGSKEYLDGSKAIAELVAKSFEQEEFIQRIALERDIHEQNSKMQTAELIVKLGTSVLHFGAMGLLTVGVMRFEQDGILRSKVWAWIPKLWDSKAM